MTLSFSQKINGKPNLFVEKIHRGLSMSLEEYQIFELAWFNKFGQYWDGCSDPGHIHSKIHTIREDKHDRWKAGMDIHMVVNNRSADRFQFAPIIKVKSTQFIQIRWDEGRPYLSIKNQQNPTFSLLYFKNKVGVSFGEDRMLELALNDGFASVEDFFKYFNQDFNGKIISWTDKKY